MDLMQKRYKVIADYPGCPYEVGTILVADETGELYSPESGYTRSICRIMKSQVNRFKANVRVMPWWEERSLVDGPKHIKAKGGIYPVHNCHNSGLIIVKENGLERIGYKGTELATLADYETYLASINKQGGV